MTPEKLAQRLASALDARDQANKALRRAWRDTDSDDETSERQLVRWCRQSATAETELRILLEIIGDRMVKMRRDKSSLNEKSAKARRLSGEIARLELLLECENPAEVYRLFPAMTRQKKTRRRGTTIHLVPQLIGVFISLTVVVSVFMPWLPLRGIDRENLVSLVRSLNRAGLPGWVWMVPIAAGCMGMAAALIPRRRIRGPAMTLIVSLSAVWTVAMAGEFVAAVKVVAVGPIVPANAGPGVFMFLSGLAGMLATGCIECLQFRRGRRFAVACICCAVAISVVSPSLRTPRPRVLVESWGDKSGPEPVCKTVVKIQNRGGKDMRIFSGMPDEPDPGSFVVSVQRMVPGAGRGIERPVETFMRGNVSFPIILSRKETVNLNLEFRPVWVEVPEEAGIPALTVSAAGTYRLIVANSVRGPITESVIEVKPMEHVETNAAMLLVQVRELIEAGNFFRADAMSQRILDVYADTRAADKVSDLRSYIEVAMSLDSELEHMTENIGESTDLVTDGNIEQAGRLLELSARRVDELLDVVPDDQRLLDMRDRLAAQISRTVGVGREQKALELVAQMDVLADRDEMEQAAVLAKTLRNEFADTSAYGQVASRIDVLLRTQALADRFDLVRDLIEITLPSLFEGVAHSSSHL